MKRMAAWLMAAVLVLSAAGCGGSAPAAESSPGMTGMTGTTGADSSAVTPAPSEAAEKLPENIILTTLPPVNDALTETVGTEEVRYTVTRDVLENTLRAADGTRLAEVRYALPLLQAVVEVDEEDVILTEENSSTDTRKNALAVTAAFNAGFDAWRQDNETLKMYAEGDFGQRPEMFRDIGMYYADSLDFTVWQTDLLVSVRGDSYSYYGGAHPNTLLLAWNFDLEKGGFISPLAIGADESEFRAVVAEELAVLADERAAELQMEPTVLYWEDYRTILQSWSDYAVSFDTAGMTVSFSPYELGCYASGAQEFTISYAYLEPYLSGYGRELLGLTGS